MVEEEGFIDIMKQTMLPIEAVDYLTKNPEGLTREGCLVTLNQWKHGSRNKYTIKKYDEMLKRCKNFSTSGKIPNGKTILAKLDNKVTWSDFTDEKGNIVQQQKIEVET